MHVTCHMHIYYCFEIGTVVDEQVEHLMVWADDFTPSDTITGKWTNNEKKKATDYLQFSCVLSFQKTKGHINRVDN